MRELHSILKRVAGKLARARMLRMAAIGAGAAAGACAVLELHWWAMARGHPQTTILLLIAAAVAAVAALLPSIIADLLRPPKSRDARFMVRVCGMVALAILGVGVGLGPRREGIAGWLPPAAAMSAGALLGAIASLLETFFFAAKGVLLPQAALYLDRRFGLQERASTACELMSQGSAGEPWAQCVCSQAFAAIEEAHVLAQPIRMPPRLLALAALAALLCLAMALLPGAQKPAGSEITARQLADALPTLTEQLKQQWIERLKQAAREAAGKPAVEANFAKAAQAAEQSDPEAMARALERLAAAGVELRSVIPSDMLSSVHAQTHPANGQAAIATADNPSASLPSAEGSPPADYVRVMNPQYGPASSGSVDHAQASTMLPWQDAWELARARALQAVSTGGIPPRRRQLVRDFFGADCDFFGNRAMR